MLDKCKIVIFFKKYCYIVFPIITIVIFIVLINNNLIDFRKIDNNLSTLVEISGTLVGFLFTAMTIFLSLNKDTNYMKNFKRYNHHIIFSRLVSSGIFSLCLNIILWMFNFESKIVIITFIIGFEETLMATYYTYKLSLNSFKQF